MSESYGVQVHHILPIAVFEVFKTQIAAWTKGDFKLHGVYNLTATNSNPTIAADSGIPVHNGSHGWLNTAWTNALNQIIREGGSNEQMAAKFKGLHTYFRSGLDYSGSSGVKPTFASTSDPKALEYFKGLYGDGVTEVTSDMLKDYTLANHNWDAIKQDTAYNHGVNNTSSNGSYGSINADGYVVPVADGLVDGVPYYVVNAENRRNALGTEYVTETYTDPNTGETRDRTIVQTTPTDAYGHHGTNSVGYEQAFVDKIRGTISQESGTPFDKAGEVADFVAGQAEAMFNAPNYQLPDALRNVKVGGIGGAIGDVAELIDALYEPAKKGFRGEGWGDFGDTVLQYGSSAVVSALLIGAGAFAATALSPALGVAFAAGVVAYGAYEAVVAISSLVGKISNDFDAVAEFMNSLWDSVSDLGDFLNFLFPDWFTDFPWVSPLVIDMDGDGIETIGLVESFTYFDLNNDGFAERTGWVSPDDALLVRDGNGDGVINHGFELFGTSTRDGFSVLGAYDENSDGVITSADRVFEELRVWRDANANGKQDDGEMQSLAQLGITSIDVAGVEELTTPTLINDNKITHTSTITYASGGHAAIADVWFKTSTQDTRIILDEDFEYTLLAQKLPQLEGKGTVPDLRYVMSLDTELAAMVKDLVLSAEGMTSQEFRTAFEAVFMRWVNSPEVTVSPFPNTLPPEDADLATVVESGAIGTSRGLWWGFVNNGVDRNPQSFMDQAHVEALEKVLGFEFLQARGGNAGTDVPHRNASFELEWQYQALVDSYLTAFSAQILGSASKFTDEMPSGAGTNNAVSQTFDSPFLQISLALGRGLNLATDPVSIGQIVLSGLPSDAAEAIKFLDVISGSLRGLLSTTFNQDTTAFEAWLRLAFAEIDNIALLEFAVQRALSAAPAFGTNAGEVISITDVRPYTVYDDRHDPRSTVWSAAGDDTVGAGIGSDTYLFLKGDGHDIVFDDNLDPGKFSAVDQVLIVDRDASSAIFEKSGLNLIIRFSDSTTDSVTLTNYFQSTLTSVEQRIEKIVFADQVFTYANVTETLLLGGAILDQSILGTSGNDTITSGVGNDALLGREGNDTYIHTIGSGQDTIADLVGTDDKLVLSGIKFEDVVITRNGADLTITKDATDSVTILGQSQSGLNFSGIEYFEFAGGVTIGNLALEYIAQTYVPTMLGEANVLNGEVNDITGKKDTFFESGAAPLKFIGYLGSDFYTYHADDAAIVIDETNNTGVFIAGQSGRDVDILHFADLAFSDLTFEIQFPANYVQSDVASFRNYYGGSDLVLLKDGIEVVRIQTQYNSGGGIDLFSDKNGMLLTNHQTMSASISVGTESADYFFGLDYRDRTLPSRPIIAVNDVMEGRGGDDRLEGWSGSDTYIYSSGDGSDIISDQSTIDDSHDPSIDVDTLILKDLNRSDVQLEWIYGQDYNSGDTSLFFTDEFVLHLGIRDLSTNSVIKVVNQNIQGMSGLEQIVFANGEILDRTAIAEETQFFGTDNGEHIVGFNVNAGKGDDVVSGVNIGVFDTAGIYWQDVAVEYTENSADTLIYTKGDGNDFISNIELIEFADLSSKDVTLEKRGDSLLIRIVETGEVITAQHYFNSLLPRVEKPMLDAWGYPIYDDVGNTLTELGGPPVNIDRIELMLPTDVLTVSPTGFRNFYYTQNTSTAEYFEWLRIDREEYGLGYDIHGDQRIWGTAPEGVTSIDIQISGHISWANNEFAIDTFEAQQTELVTIPVINGQVDFDIKTYFVDPINDRVTYDASGLPAWLTYEPATRLLTGVPPAGFDLSTLTDLTITMHWGRLSTKVPITNFMPYDGSTLQGIVFADGEIWGQTDIDARASVIGTSSNETLFADEIGGKINGGAGDDIIAGNAGNDVIIGGDGYDQLFGADGDDVFVAGIQDAVMDGGAGVDTISLGKVASAVTINLESGTATGGTIIAAISNIEAIIGSKFDDIIVGSTSNDSLDGAAGDDSILGGDGADTINGGAGADNLDGGIGTDTLSYLSGLSGVEVDLALGVGLHGDAQGDQISNFEIVVGTHFADGIRGSAHADILNAGSGNDIVSGQDGDDTIFGESGNDTLSGDAGNDILNGGTGSDTLLGGSGDDTLEGGKGIDQLIDGQGNDTFVWTLGDGNDAIVSDPTLGSAPTDSDVLRLKGVTAAEVSLQSDRDHLIVKFNNGEDIQIEDQFLHNGAANGVNSIVFDDGTVWSRSHIAIIAIATQNAAPLAVTDRFAMQSGATLNIFAVGLIANDFDVEGDALSLTNVSGAVGGAVSLLQDGTVQFIAQTGFVGLAGFNYEVTDALGAKSNGAVRIEVTQSTNLSPIIAKPLLDQVFDEDVELSFTIPANSFADPDDDTLFYSATLADGYVLPSWLSFDATSLTFAGRPPENSNGDIEVKVIASDGSTGVSGLFTLTIAAVNDAPELINAVADQTSHEDQTVSFALPANTFNDLDDDLLSLSAKLATGDALPEWLVFNAGSASFSGIPPANFNGLISVLVTATDGSFSATDVFDIVVTPANDAPALAAALLDSLSAEDQAISISISNGTFTDVDGDKITYSAGLADGSALPDWLSINSTTGTFNGMPPANYFGQLSIIVTASDGNLDVSDELTLTVSSINDAPVVSILLEDTASLEDQAVNFALPPNTFLDVDGNILTLSAELADGSTLPSWLSFNAMTGVFSGMPPLDFAGDLNVIVSASDGELSTFDTFTLVISPVNDAPIVALNLPDKTLEEDIVVNFTLPANAFEDVESENLVYSATLSTGAALPTWLSFNATTLTFSGTPPSNYFGSFDIVVSASDGSLVATDRFNLNVTPVNDAPTAVNDGPFSVAYNSALTILATTLLGNDNDVDGASLTIKSVQNAVNGIVSWSASGNIIFTPTIGFSGQASFEYTLNDGDGGTAFATVLLSVSSGSSTIIGTTGSDLLFGTSASDTINALAGSDIVFAGSGNDVVKGGSGSDILFGDDGNDTVNGGDGDDYIFGANGNDTVIGGAGADMIDGGNGNDILSGQFGNDLMSGGSGSDSFVFTTGFGRDRILDFQAGAVQSDVIRLSLGSNFNSFAEILAVTQNVQGSAEITISLGETITLLGVSKSALVANDFLFT